MKNDFLENDLNNAILKNNKNKLIYIGINYGFLNDNYRFESYLKLLDIKSDLISENIYNQIEAKEDEINQINIIKKDILRTFHNKKFIGINGLNKDDLIKVLDVIIIKFFFKNKQYKYYQGFNSLGEVLYLKYGKPFSFIILEKLCSNNFHIYLTNSHVKEMQLKINQIKILLKEFYPVYFDILKNE